jgi:L-seryl-tRNA(Ser) seleniumtransferase
MTMTGRPPSVERLLDAVRGRTGPRDGTALVDLARMVIDEERGRISGGAEPRAVDDLADAVVARLDGLGDRPIRTINATGVILHTNLGRAPWPAAAIEAAREAAGNLFLEMDRASGKRGKRYRAAEEHLIALTGAEDAVVTNNNAAAVVLACHLAGRRGIAVARGELVEIGGGVRIPEIVRRAGARLVEVGTTNKTRIADFEEVLADGRAVAVLRVHASNFRMTGFVEAPDPAELAAIAHHHGALLIDDLGSGALLDTAAFGLPHEPTPMERLAAGADLVTFSGDKLVGGPQAGLVVGRRDLIGRIRKDPLARAMRPDKVTLAAMSATLALYRAGTVTRDIPVWQAIAVSADSLRERAEALSRRLGGLGVASIPVALESTVGGGSLPEATLSSWGIALGNRHPDRTLARLRGWTPAIVARIEDDAVVLDLRTVEAAWDERGVLAGAIAGALADTAEGRP